MLIFVDESSFFKSMNNPSMFKAIVNSIPNIDEAKNTVRLMVEVEINTMRVMKSDKEEIKDGIAILTSDCL